MAKFEILDGKLFCDLLHQPDYVWFRCVDYDLPDNTTGQIGYHCIFRPLVRDLRYTGHELITDAMMADVRKLYDAEKAAENAAKENRRLALQAAHDAFMHALDRIPDAAAAELQALNADYARMARGQNEGGEGYVHIVSWTDRTGREILARHGVGGLADEIAEAYTVLHR